MKAIGHSVSKCLRALKKEKGSSKGGKELVKKKDNCRRENPLGPAQDAQSKIRL